MKLCLGAGGRERLPGYYSVDIMQHGNIDLVHAVDRLPMIKDGTVEICYSSHVLEHISRMRTREVLAEWHRILKPGGTLRVAVPDFEALAVLYIDTLAERGEDVDRDRFGNALSFPLARVLGPIVGGQTGIYDFHQALFDFESLKLQLEEVGFIDVRRYDWRQTEHYRIDDYSQSYWPPFCHRGGRPDGPVVERSEDVEGLLLSLNVEAAKP